MVLRPRLGLPASLRHPWKVFTEADVQAEAQRIASLQRLNDRCENLFKEGAEKHGATSGRRGSPQVGQAFGGAPAEQPRLVRSPDLDPERADVYNALAADLDHFGEVLAMRPLDLGMELADALDQGRAKPKGPPVSKAPPHRRRRGRSGRQEGRIEKPCRSPLEAG
jgi:hypothetical protein